MASLFDPETISAFPTDPGVYIMRNASGEVIYVGKAANLRSRVRNYFTRTGDTRPSVEFLRRHVAAIDTIVTPSEKDAFLLENTLIKQHQPRYNIRLRDDKTYISLRLRMNHDYPRLETVRVRGVRTARDNPAAGGTQTETAPPDSRRTGSRRPREEDLYFGPYTSASAVRETLRFLLKIFPVRTCKDSVFRNRTRPCILFDVGKCCGPCTEPVSREEYRALVDKVAAFLRGKDFEVRRALEERMYEFSEKMEFEKAALIRDRIRALDETLERQQTAQHKARDADVLAVASREGRSLVILHQYRNGTLLHALEYYVKNYEQGDDEILYSFISQHYDPDGPHLPPPEILTTTDPQDRELLEEVLRERRGGAVEIAVPRRGDRMRLARNADVNARQALARRLAGEHSENENLAEIQKRLDLPKLPRAIECVDISNIMGALAVGSLVRFEDARPDKSGYRLYRIRTVKGSNDFAMMREVLLRRYSPEATNARPLPDLLMVDGGKGQLGVAEQVLAELGLTDKVMLCAIAKSRLKVRPAGGAHAGEPIRFRTEERIFLPGRKNPVTFPPNSPALHLLERVRDETHRTAITFHRKVREKANRRSALDEIPGIGPRRKAILLRHFGSLTAIRQASVEEIAAVDGISRDAAEAVHRFLNAEASADQALLQELDAEEAARETADDELQELAREELEDSPDRLPPRPATDDPLES